MSWKDTPFESPFRASPFDLGAAPAGPAGFYQVTGLLAGSAGFGWSVGDVINLRRVVDDGSVNLGQVIVTVEAGGAAFGFVQNSAGAYLTDPNGQNLEDSPGDAGGAFQVTATSSAFNAGGTQFWEILTVAVANLGNGYSLGDILELDLGPNIAPAYVEVTNESGGSLGVNGLTIIGKGGTYPSDPVSQASNLTSITGSGFGANCTISTTQLT